LIELGSGKSSIRFAPPLNINRELIDEGLMMLEDALTEVEGSA
jgi:4-aminobutyrate aminotransferase-like enzyme